MDARIIFFIPIDQKENWVDTLTANQAMDKNRTQEAGFGSWFPSDRRENFFLKASNMRNIGCTVPKLIR